MTASKNDRKAKDQSGQDVRLSPKLVPIINIVLTRRFVDAMSFPELLKSLEVDGIRISIDRLQKFVARLLYLLGDEQAVRLGVNQQLLMVIRRRLRLSPKPPRIRVAVRRRRKRFDPRNRQRRRITVEPKVRRTSPPPSRFQGTPSTLKAQPLPTGLVSQTEPTQEEVAAYQRLSRKELNDLNKVARQKLRVFTRDVLTNWRGSCISIRTQQDISAEQLREQFGLTYAEAETCFITLDQSTRAR